MAPPQWAYQVENFVTEPDEELVCSICRAVFCEPVMCPCDHVFCRACINKWIQSSRNCPICRERVSQSLIKQNVPIVKNIIMKLMLNCNNKSHGCTAQFSIESSEAHIKECQYEVVQCKNKPCKHKSFRKDIAEHENNDCLHRYIKCKTCGSKLPSSLKPEAHDCMQHLRLRLRRKKHAIRKKNAKIEELKNEIKALKSASRESEQSLANASRTFARLASGLSPEEIMINIAEMESTSSSVTSLSSDESSDDSILIFADSSLEAEDNTDSESWFSFMDTSRPTEYRRSASPDYRTLYNAESQTTDSMWTQPLEETNVEFESGTSSGAPAERGERSQSRLPAKRRPATVKPAKRRLSHAESNERVCFSPFRDPRQERPLNVPQPFRESNSGNSVSLSMAPGPSTGAGPSVEFRQNSDRKCQSDLHRKCAKRTSNLGGNDESSVAAAAAPSRNAVFERTLALLEQYNLDSDPEWLPEYASHTGDTTTDSDSSDEAVEFLTDCSSSSELSDCVSNLEDNSHAVGISDLVNWSLDDTSDEDDPDWNPLDCLTKKYS